MDTLKPINMANIFNKTNNLYENPKRNTFDLSFQNNLTLNMGELVPVFCKECIPGDSFKIDPTISLRMMPLLFPVQTRLRAHLHFFYVTNRSLWKDWQDFIGNTRQSLELPYLKPSFKDFKTGKLADYLGIPTTVVSGTPTSSRPKWFSGDYINVNVNELSDNRRKYSFSLNPVYSDKPTPIVYNSVAYDNWFTALDYWMVFNEVTAALGLAGTVGYNIQNNLQRVRGEGAVTIYNENSNIQNVLSSELYFTPITDESTYSNILYYCPRVGNVLKNLDGSDASYFELLSSEYMSNIVVEWLSTKSVTVILRSNEKDSSKDELLVASFRSDEVDDGIRINLGPNAKYSCYSLNKGTTMSTLRPAVDFFKEHSNIDAILMFNVVDLKSILNNNSSLGGLLCDKMTIRVKRSQLEFTDVINYIDEPDEIDIENNAFNDSIRISALPWRAYEAIYNSFYRDERNNPLIVDGEPVYNKFLRNYDGGVDDVVNRDLYKRNWESDFLTTAVHSPQQGVAPLVGITVNGEISFKDSDTGEIYSAKLNSSDGDKIDNFTVTSPNMPNANLRQLVDFASSGISISDLRGVNALQRWLEINMRRGLRYKDQIMSHFGVNVHYDELMMPEFIGGMSTDIYINQINQTTPTAGSPLGSFAGQGGAFGSSGHSINHYCQEHGYIIGILSISPTPQYSQLLPKHFLKRELLDFFFPEFGHLGMQPITYNEVAPNESFATGQPLDDVFGYQRAWYDYLASVDEVHGLFRTNLNNFVVQRYFDGRPDLSPDFLTIDPQTLDSVFAVNAGDDSHKFLGQVYFDCKVKRPIPEYGVPRLEV